MVLQLSLVFILAGGIAALYWTLLRNASCRIAAQYAALGERFGLELGEPPPRLLGFVRPEPYLHGICDGRELSVSAQGKGLQNTRQIETVVKLRVADGGLRFQMTASGLLGRLRQRDSGGQEAWKSGDAAFDAAVDVRTNRPEAMAAVLDDALRQTLRDLLEGPRGSLYLGNDTLVFAEFGLIADAARRERYERVIGALYALASAVEAA